MNKIREALKKIHLYKVIVNIYGYGRKIYLLICKGFGELYRKFCILTKSEQLYIVNIEGGITSQLEQYVFGQRLQELGYKIKYDLSTYKNGTSMDCLGHDVRNLDIQKLDNKIYLDVATEKSIKKYKKFFSYSLDIKKCQKVNSANIPSAPLYFGGYGYGIYSEEAYEEAFSKYISLEYDKNEFGEKNLALLERIELDDMAVGIHVRRGDTLLPEVGRPIPKKEYYLYAISFFPEDSNLYFFSDGMDWVEENIVPYIKNCERCILVRNNGADKGWCDLILMSKCRHQIKSPSGGLARDAYRLNHNPDKKAVIPVLIKGNMSALKGNIIEIELNEDLCDMQYVKNYSIRL